MRCGVITRKIGMTRLFNEAGEHVPVTVLQLDNVQVVATKTVERDGYRAVQLGAGQAKVKNVSKPLARVILPKRRFCPSANWLNFG